ncbi:globin domain-containing protein [Ahniella affigens]|nr:globin domain-containing protein [Ahniella affigens]
MNAAAESFVQDLLSKTDHPILKHSLSNVASDPAAFAGRFYANLFAAMPGLRVLFPADLSEQQMKLAQTLAMVVSGLDESDAMVPLLRRLGAAHRGYGTKPAHYQVVGDVLIKTLSDTCGPDWNDDLERSWQRLYQWVAANMIAGAQAAAHAGAKPKF